MSQQIFHSFREIPPGISTSESWMRNRRKVISKSHPVAFFRPDDFVPEHFGYEQGIPLYGRDQTKDYNPQPHTIAAWEYYDHFVANQNRYKHGMWDDGKRVLGDVPPTWRTYEKYLSNAKIRAHLRGKDIYGCWGNLSTNWFCVEPDYHGGDPGLFLDMLPILDEFTMFFPNARWFYGLNRNGISGLHLFGLLPQPRLLEDIHRDVQKVLVYLEDENLNRLMKYKPANVADDQFHPVANLEVYPATNHNFRLPYARDRITVTDEWLNLPGQVDLKPNAVKFMAYVQDKNRQAVPMADVIEYIKANIQYKPPKQSREAKRTTTGGGNGRGHVEPLKGRHLKFITGVVLGTEAMPSDTIGSWATPALRHLMLVDGLEPDEALDKLAAFYDMIPDKSFSDRLASGDIGELLRTDAYTVNKIEGGNLYQPRPEESSDIFAKVKARCQQIGFVFADPETWHVLGRHKSAAVDVSDMDFTLTFEEKLAVKEPGAALLRCDVPSVYQAAHRIKAFVTKYPGKELPAILVPVLCTDLPINWHVGGDGRSKKAEKFLGMVCGLGIIKKVRDKKWCGVGNSRNRAAMYGLPGDKVDVDWGTWWKTSPRGVGEGDSFYITAPCVLSPLDFDDLLLEVERLNRPWQPQYHSSG